MVYRVEDCDKNKVSRQHINERDSMEVIRAAEHDDL